MDIDTIKKMLMEKVNFSEKPFLPKALNDERLEDAFKFPICNEEGYAPCMPAIWNSRRHGKTSEGVKVLSLRSALTAPRLYSKYLDEEALVWDADSRELFLYIPDEKCRTVAFKGGCWLCAKKLKSEYMMEFSIYDIYVELQAEIDEELKLKNE